jgi:hypothetical protein
MSKKRLALLASAILIGAIELCGGNASSAQAPAAGVGEGTAGAAPQTEPTPRIKTSRLRGSPGKPVAPIAIDYELSSPPQLGVPFDVQITLAARDGVTDLALTVHAGAGIEVGTPQPMSSSADGAQGTWTIAATAYQQGTSYLGVLAQGTAGDQHPSRNLVIPIRIGTAAPAQQAAKTSSPNASTQRVIVLQSEDR